MKKALFICLSLLLMVGVATIVWAAVSGTPHDVQVWSGTAGLEPCASCHTPHAGSGDYPLWNRNGITNGYSTYTSPTMDMSIITADTLYPPSTVCMSCHDGTASSLVNYPGPGSTQNTNYDSGAFGFSAYSNLGLLMQNDHPVSFNYDAAADLDNNGFPGAVGGFVVGTLANYPLYDGASPDNNRANNVAFECSTCHSVHDTAVYGGKGTSQVYFLRISNAGSNMCSDCHVNR